MVPNLIKNLVTESGKLSLKVAECGAKETAELLMFWNDIASVKSGSFKLPLMWRKLS